MPEEQAIIFHHIITKLLFLATQTWRGTTRGQQPNEDDWGKLLQAIKYLNGTNNVCLKSRIDNLGMTKLWVASAHAV